MNQAPRLAAAILGSGAILLGLGAFDSERNLFKRKSAAAFDRIIERNAEGALAEGRETFRYDTFGDEAFWGDLLRLHEAIAGAGLGGVGPGVSPRLALEVGLKVDADALSKSVLQAIQEGRVDLDDPAVTLELLRQNAVVGVTGFFDGRNLRSVGIQCALCHSTVDNRVAPGVGSRLDGWANRDLNVGAIVALAPNLQPFADLLGVDQATVRTVLNSWGPGKFDAELVLDGKAFRPDGKSAATLIPPAFGLAGVNLHTWTGWGSVTHWNAFVSNLEMHGKGTFFDPRLDDAAQFPIAARERFGHIRNTPDLITSKLAALHVYQLDIPAPKPPDGFFDAAAAQRGAALFTGKAECATCHVPPIFSEPGWNMHTPAEIGIDAFQADRSPDRRYRTAPLKGLWTHMKGGFYHDGRFPTLRAVIDHYDAHFTLGLSDDEKRDLEEYLKSLGDAPAPGVVLTASAAGGEARPATRQQEIELRTESANPANDAIQFEVVLPVAAAAEVKVFDVAGRHVATPVRSQELAAGAHRFTWDRRRGDGSLALAGVYYLRLVTRDLTRTRVVTLLAR